MQLNLIGLQTCYGLQQAMTWNMTWKMQRQRSQKLGSVCSVLAGNCLEQRQRCEATSCKTIQHSMQFAMRLSSTELDLVPKQVPFVDF